MNWWPSCGYERLQLSDTGWLVPTPDYLRLWLEERPELALVPESCKAERRLHEALREDPLRRVDAGELARLKDVDARENYRLFLALRDGLESAGSLEGWYLGLMRSGRIEVPPLFIDLVVQAMLRHLLRESDDVLQLRAAELFFRPQRVTVQDGQVLCADQAVVEQYSRNAGLGELGRLLVENKTALREAELTVLDASNAAAYRERSERYRYLLDLTHEVTQDLSHGLTLRMTRARSGLKGLARVLEAWTQHLLGVTVTIEPLARVDDATWRWHVGLDAQATAILNQLYEGQAVDAAQLQRLISLFRLTFAHAAPVQPGMQGKPVYLGLAMNAQGLLRLKPQNLLLNLPLAQAS
ncbi:MAG: DUF6352 family protein [Curvibacter sp.]